MNRLLTFVILLTLHFVGFAQTSPETDNDFEKFFKVGGDIITQPAKFTSEDWIKVSTTLGITGLATLIDKEIKEFSKSNRSQFLNNLFSIDKYYHIEGIAISIAVIYGYGALNNNDKMKNLGLRLTEATVYSGIIDLAAKVIIGRSRPTNIDDQYVFQPFSFSFENTALPSGHTTLSFAYSTVMANEYNNFFWKFGWYSLAGLVGYARIYNNQHWFSDVFLGAALGYFIGEFVINHKSNQKIQSDKIAVPQPVISFKIPL